MQEEVSGQSIGLDLVSSKFPITANFILKIDDNMKCIISQYFFACAQVCIYQPVKKDHLLPQQNPFEMTMLLLAQTSNVPVSFGLFLNSLVEASHSVLFMLIPGFWPLTKHKSLKAKGPTGAKAHKENLAQAP